VSETCFQHAREHVLAAFLRRLGVADGIELRGRLGQPREQRRLGQRERLHRLAEIGLRCGGEAIGALPEVDLVEVELEDLILAQFALDLEGEQDLVELAV